MEPVIPGLATGSTGISDCIETASFSFSRVWQKFCLPCTRVVDASCCAEVLDNYRVEEDWNDEWSFLGSTSSVLQD